jgi:hypothetical protein
MAQGTKFTWEEDFPDGLVKLAPNGFFRASAKYMMPQVDEKSRK